MSMISPSREQSIAFHTDRSTPDISMPIMDGITATSEIRDYEQQKALPPSTIMAVTGVASTTVQQRAFGAGVNDYLVKPISLHDLKRIMDIQ